MAPQGKCAGDATDIYIELTNPLVFSSCGGPEMHVRLRFCSDKITVVVHLKITWTGMDKILSFIISIVSLYDVLIFMQSYFIAIT